jgi:hypothetical protein
MPEPAVGYKLLAFSVHLQMAQIRHRGLTTRVRTPGVRHEGGGHNACLWGDRPVLTGTGISLHQCLALPHHISEGGCLGGTRKPPALGGRRAETQAVRRFLPARQGERGGVRVDGERPAMQGWWCC